MAFSNGGICNHYWVINSPNGPTSVGTCRLCGDEKEFKNSVHEAGWDREGSELRARRAMMVSKSGS